MVPEAETIRRAGMSVTRSPQLSHPAVAALVPTSAQTLYVRASSATTKRAVSIVTCVTYKFEVGRHGQSFMDATNLVSGGFLKKSCIVCP